jgi:hypothetical protein
LIASSFPQGSSHFALQATSVGAERVFSRAKSVSAAGRFSTEQKTLVVMAAITRAIANKFPGFRTVDLELGV